ncbi:MAG: MlaD family protein [Proteobacteria bacterium]|nr:MlaD family protein [Pseudomonadota bacterium]
MVKKKMYFNVGLFVTIGILIGVSAIVWVGASKYFQEGTIFVTYFDESVQGLQIDSSVKYRGVDIGRVMKIGVAPDNRLVEVVMKIEFRGNVVRDTVAKLRTAGITGIVFVELERRKPEDIKLSPKIDFTTRYPVIQSLPSDIKQIFSAVDSIMEKIKQIDFKGISNQLIDTTKAVEIFVGGDRMKRILSNIEYTVANLESATDKVNDIMTEGIIEDVVTEAKDAIKEAKTVITRVKTEVDSLNVAETTGKANQLIENMNKKMNTAATEITVTSENLRRVSETLENLMERLSADPSELIFSIPPTQKRAK